MLSTVAAEATAARATVFTLFPAAPPVLGEPAHDAYHRGQ